MAFSYGHFVFPATGNHEIYIGINISDIMPTKEIITDKTSFLVGFCPAIADIIVDAIITPPVVNGLWIDAGKTKITI